MAYIKHFFREEKVCDNCNDRGVSFQAWVTKNVEHHCCSECGAEVDKNSSFCSKCGVKLTGIKDSKKGCSCEVCGSKFTQMRHEREVCCSRCRRLIQNNYGVELAKAFYKLGKKQQAEVRVHE